MIRQPLTSKGKKREQLTLCCLGFRLLCFAPSRTLEDKGYNSAKPKRVQSF